MGKLFSCNMVRFYVIPCITNTFYSTENHLRFPFEIDRKLKPSLVSSLATHKKYKQKKLWSWSREAISWGVARAWPYNEAACKLRHRLLNLRIQLMSWRQTLNIYETCFTNVKNWDILYSGHYLLLLGTLSTWQKRNNHKRISKSSLISYDDVKLNNSYSVL